jgi:hypothetical protein
MAKGKKVEDITPEDLHIDWDESAVKAKIGQLFKVIRQNLEEALHPMTAFVIVRRDATNIEDALKVLQDNTDLLVHTVFALSDTLNILTGDEEIAAILRKRKVRKD